HLPHGRLNALILPHVIHFNAADGTAAEKYGRLARLCGLAANPRSLAAGLNRLRAQLKLPERLSACGVEGKELTAALDGLAEAAQADLCAPSNPRPAAAEDLKSLLRELA
ncbi:iron-containing alcohol dehydrogenase, partial [Flavonifractor plautii]